MLQTAAIRFTSARNLEQIKKCSFTGQNILPVVSSAGGKQFKNPLLVSVNVSGDVGQDPRLDLAVSLLQTTAAFLIASHVKNRADLKRPEIQAALLKELFGGGVGNSMIQFNAAGGFTIERSALKLYLAHLTEREFSEAA